MIDENDLRMFENETYEDEEVVSCEHRGLGSYFEPPEPCVEDAVPGQRYCGYHLSWYGYDELY